MLEQDEDKEERVIKVGDAMYSDYVVYHKGKMINDVVGLIRQKRLKDEDDDNVN